VPRELFNKSREDAPRAVRCRDHPCRDRTHQQCLRSAVPCAVPWPVQGPPRCRCNAFFAGRCVLTSLSVKVRASPCRCNRAGACRSNARFAIAALPRFAASVQCALAVKSASQSVLRADVVGARANARSEVCSDVRRVPAVCPSRDR